MNEYTEFRLRFDEEYAGRVQEQKERILEQKERIIEQKDRIIEQKDRIIEQKDRILEQTEHIIEQTEQMIKNKNLIHEFEQLKTRYETSIRKRSMVHLRIRHAFPKLTLPTFREMMDHLDALRA